MKISSTQSPQSAPVLTTTVAPPRLTPDSSVALPQLVPGQILHARVLAVGADGLATLEVEGQTLWARSSVPLEVGREFWLEVRQPGPPPWLVPAEQKGVAQELFRFIIEARQAAPQMLPHLEVLQKMVAGQGGEPGPELTKLTTLLETFAADHAPAPERLALLVAWLEGGRRGGKAAFPAPLAKEIDALVTALGRKGKLLPAEAREHLESLSKSARLLDAVAAGNSVSSEGREQWFLYPCLFTGATGWGEWFVELPDRGAPGSATEDFRLSFFLDMSRLGEVSLQVTAGKQTLQGVFKAATEEARQHLAAGIPELAAALESLGFGSVSLSSAVTSGSLVQQLREKLQAKTASQTFSLLSVRV